MGRFLKLLGLFLGLYVLLVVGLQMRARLGFGNATLGAKWKHIQAQPADTYNHIAIGSSRILCHIMPAVFDSVCQAQQLDLRTFNMGAAATFMPQTLPVLDTLLASCDSTDLKLITMELTTPQIPQNHQHERETYYWNVQTFGVTARYILNRNAPWSHRLRQAQALMKPYLSAQLLLGQTSLLQSFFHPTQTLNPEEAHAATRGHFSLQAEFERSKPAWWVQQFRDDFTANGDEIQKRVALNIKEHHAPRPSRPNAYFIDFLREKIEQARAKGIHLLFILPPPADAHRELLGIADHLPQGHILDFTSPESFPFLYAEEQQFDLGHLNDRGSTRFSEQLANAVVRLLRPAAFAGCFRHQHDAEAGAGRQVPGSG